MRQICLHTHVLFTLEERSRNSQSGYSNRLEATGFRRLPVRRIDRFISPPFALTCTILSNKDWKAFFFSVIVSPPSGGAQGWCELCPALPILSYSKHRSACWMYVGKYVEAKRW